MRGFPAHTTHIRVYRGRNHCDRRNDHLSRTFFTTIFVLLTLPAASSVCEYVFGSYEFSDECNEPSRISRVWKFDRQPYD